MLGEIVARDIEPHVPVWDKSKRDDDTLSREDFSFDPERGVYICPQGKTMRTTGRVFGGNTLYYRASKLDCERCSLKQQCCPRSPARRIPRDLNEHARDRAREITKTEGYRTSARQRKMIETGFGDMKRNLGMTRLRLRGLTGASDEFLLAATVQNLRRLAKAMWPPEANAAPATG